MVGEGADPEEELRKIEAALRTLLADVRRLRASIAGTNAPRPKPGVYTIKSCADLYSVSRATIYKWIKEGRLGCVRLPGGDFRIRAQDIEAFDASHFSAPE